MPPAFAPVQGAKHFRHGPTDLRLPDLTVRHAGMKRIAILGSTGSIGRSSLEVVQGHPEQMCVAGLTAHRGFEVLAQQCRSFHPRMVALADGELRETVTGVDFGRGTEVLFGAEGVERIASHPDVDVVIAGIVGAAGLRGTWAAIEAGKQIGLANKETMVIAGPLVTERIRETGARIIPVDSEHSAIFQTLQCGRRNEVRRVILTASGGPFRGWTPEQLQGVTPEMALAHPTWEMGPKITVDSATMMNKALEIIEARWLFDLEPDQIEVVIHPQSIVHSMVEFVDGSVIAQLSPPDMKLPIQYALTWPDRADGVSPRMDFSRACALEFAPPDREAFPALELGFEVARRGGTCGAVLNAANEVAVQRFLDRDLAFPDISTACRDVLSCHDYDSRPTLDALLHLDRWARQEMLTWKSSSSR
jgi:1-deoxy-D-xylulose-5-phosphate reductoisomerase